MSNQFEREIDMHDLQKMTSEILLKIAKSTKIELNL
jgi:hypothetical protein